MKPRDSPKGVHYWTPFLLEHCMKIPYNKAMKRLGLFIIFLIGGGILFSWIITHVGWEEILRIALEFSPEKWLLILFLSVLMMVLGVVRWRGILQSKHEHISFWAAFRLYLAGYSLIFFAPMVVLGGETFRAYALKESTTISFSKSFSSVIIERILELTAHFFVVVLGLLIVALQSSAEESRFFLWIVFLVGIFGIAIFVFYVRSLWGRGFLSLFIRNTGGNLKEAEKEIIDFFRWRNPGFRQGLLLSILRNSIALLRTWLLVFFLTGSWNVLHALSILGFYYLALLVPTPASLGSHDVLQVFAFQAFGFSASLGAAFVLIIRTAEFLIALVGIFFLFIAGIKIVRTIVSRRVENLFSNKH